MPALNPKERMINNETGNVQAWKGNSRCAGLVIAAELCLLAEGTRAAEQIGTFQFLYMQILAIKTHGHAQGSNKTVSAVQLHMPDMGQNWAHISRPCHHLVAARFIPTGNDPLGGMLRPLWCHNSTTKRE